MNIWILNHYATTPSHSGGTRHFDMARELVKRGHSVTIIAASFNHFSKKETINYKGKPYFFEKIQGISFLWLKTLSYNSIYKRIINMISYATKAYFYAKKVLKTRSPDIIIGSSVHPLTAVAGYLLSKKFDTVFYFEERDLWPQTFVDFGKLSETNIAARLLYKLEHFLYIRARRTIVLFDSAEKYVSSRNIDARKVIYIPNGIDYERYRQMNEYKRIDQLLLSIESRFKVVYIGSHGIANHLAPLINLAEQMLRVNREVHFVLVGDGPEKKSLIDEANKKELGNITFLPPVAKEEIPYLLSKMEVGYISMKNSPLYKWGFSMNKLCDYMAAGLPIIMNCNDDLTSSLQSSGGIFSSEDINELSKKIDEFHNNKELAATMGENLKEYVYEHFSWGELCNCLEENMILDVKRRSNDKKVI